MQPIAAALNHRKSLHTVQITNTYLPYKVYLPGQDIYRASPYLYTMMQQISLNCNLLRFTLANHHTKEERKFLKLALISNTLVHLEIRNPCILATSIHQDVDDLKTFIDQICYAKNSTHPPSIKYLRMSQMHHLPLLYIRSERWNQHIITRVYNTAGDNTGTIIFYFR